MSKTEQPEATTTAAEAGHELEVVPAGETALAPAMAKKFALVAQHLDAVKTHATAAQGHAYQAGRLLLDLKYEMKSAGEHGFMDAVKQALPDYSYATARNYMDFARKLGQARPEIRQADAEQAVAMVAEVADGRSLTQLYMDLGVVKRPANQTESGDRRHYPAAKAPVERAEDAAVKRAANMVRAIDTLQIEVDHGNFDALTDEEAQVRYEQLRTLVEKIRAEVIAPRAAAKSRSAGKPGRTL